jgi:hypothetical protein
MDGRSTSLGYWRKLFVGKGSLIWKKEEEGEVNNSSSSTNHTSIGLIVGLTGPRSRPRTLSTPIRT